MQEATGSTDIGVWFPAVRAGTGTDRFTERLAAALQRRGVRTQIDWLPHRAEFLPWTVAIPKPPSWARVVHINSWLHRRFIPTHLPLLATVHSSIHDPALDVYKTAAQRIYHRAWVRGLEAEALRRARSVTAVSRHTAAMAGRVFQRGDISPVYNWIDTDAFSPAEDSRVAHSPFRLLFVGNIGRRLKGSDLLPDIMAGLGADYELWFTGDSADAGDLKLPANVRALGHLGHEVEMVAAYRNCDALLFPSRLEGLSLATLEALSCGLPIIATNGSSLPEVVIDGVTGMLCPQDDVQAFIDAARHLRANVEIRNGMAAASRKRALAEFSETVALDRYLALYRRLLEV